ncbi:recombination protein RecR [Candidatus Kaiserbacteria bacterium CG10_big_fil_rev_8_21_14_0_10_59_10]|uniref:Recombination protein RecR n=1 Tax=Candidatus Kaiserbacteria bacterium CG10_big_fil_rev_8_21_14_0_10_59_10 TaxID=1974612 RepID=A0A2H0U708_9BACT|nr:MAG: recombination protein RecR [Candidatus Kaiserbacteria bacterium CG10_big_fil_rev_8_21_14_0_10_59_10]
MHMDALDKLATLFARFPGIGPRQAHRFVQFLLRSSPSMRRELADSIRALGATVNQCDACMRYHAGAKGLCALCADPARDASMLAVVSSDADLAALERSGTYRGHYFVLGGTISLASEKAKALRERELLSRAQERASAGLREVILALPANPEGDYTAIHVRDALAALAARHGWKITMLGRGLSTGSELEYADAETLKSALENRR